MLRLKYVKLLDRLSGRRDIRAAAAPIPDPSSYPIATPFGTSDLNRLVAEDVFGSELANNTRSAAMRIPAVARARNLLVSTGCRLPLHAYNGETQLDDAAAPFVYNTGTSTSWQHRNAFTIDDLIFYGWSLWMRFNDPVTGFPLAADRIDRASWTIDADNRILINGTVMKANEVILLSGLHEGILSYGVDAIADTRRLYEVYRDRLENPVPMINLHQTEGEDMTPSERFELLTGWRNARRSKGGAGVGFTNKAVEAIEMGAGYGEQLLVEARNAASLDLARVVGVGASRIDATAPKASLNYETTTGRNQELVDFDLALYLTPIAARLSLDDVVPPGARVAFDLSDLVGLSPSLTGPETTD